MVDGSTEVDSWQSDRHGRDLRGVRGSPWEPLAAFLPAAALRSAPLHGRPNPNPGRTGRRQRGTPASRGCAAWAAAKAALPPPLQPPPPVALPLARAAATAPGQWPRATGAPAPAPARTKVVVVAAAAAAARAPWLRAQGPPPPPAAARAPPWAPSQPLTMSPLWAVRAARCAPPKRQWQPWRRWLLPGPEPQQQSGLQARPRLQNRGRCAP